MSTRFEIDPPALLPGRLISIPKRGEFFVRHSAHADPTAPVVLLLHGWTASSDLNFFTAYHELGGMASVIGIDHRGHGRGVRPDVSFTLEDCADDAAAVCAALGVSKVVAVGYSMGGPIAMLMARRHPTLVRGLVLQATALEWRGTARERARFRVGRVLGPLTRRLIRPSTIRFAFSRRITRRHPLRPHLGWMMSEWRRNDPWQMAEAGRAIARFDARPWAGTLSLPACVVLTTNDQLVAPAKQRALAEATGATVLPLEGDHFVNVVKPTEFSAVTSRAVRAVLSVPVVVPSAR
ncbi:MAG: alpha/beta fold hydrolase [Ilumatobacteraceae bacterium]